MTAPILHHEMPCAARVSACSKQACAGSTGHDSQCAAALMTQYHLLCLQHMSTNLPFNSSIHAQPRVVAQHLSGSLRSA
jgi:hypothetical protein